MRGKKAKAAVDEVDEVAQDQNLARDAILKFPTDPEKIREEFLERPKQLKEEAGDKAQIKNAHAKNLKRLYGAEAKVVSFVQWLEGRSPGLASRTLRQLDYLVDKLGLDAQYELPLNEPGSVSEDTGPVFDTSAAGDRHGTERRDDPGRAQPLAAANDAAPPPAPAPEMPLEDFRAALAANNKAAEDHIRKQSKRKLKNPLPDVEGSGNYALN